MLCTFLIWRDTLVIVTSVMKCNCMQHGPKRCPNPRVVLCYGKIGKVDVQH